MYFYWDGYYYKQLRGAAMGSLLSPVIANIYLELSERRAPVSAKLEPTSYRYLDDTFVVWPHSQEELKAFL